MGRYRSSVALAGSGLIISVFLIVKGPSFGDKGTAPLKAAAETLDLQQRELAAAVEARATTLAQLPRLAWAVATDEQTVRDLTTDELGFRTQPGEVIALAQIDKGSGKIVTLLHAPAAAAVGTPLTAPGAHPIVIGGDLMMAWVVNVEPRERADAVSGALMVARRLDVAGASDQLIRAGIAARILAPDGAATLTEVPALARQPETMLPIGASGMRIAARLPGRKTGVWIGLGIFVLLIWSSAAAIAARYGTMRPRLPLPLPLPIPVRLTNGVATGDNMLPDTTPMQDLAVAERHITASSNGYYSNGRNGVHGAAVEPVIEIVSGPVAAGVPQTEAIAASKADFPALFREFMDLRKRCGDRSKAPSYDEFFKMLNKRRKEMLDAHSASDVMFQIVFIDGRAVVRAKGVH